MQPAAFSNHTTSVMRRLFSTYLLLLAVFGTGIYAILQVGARLSQLASAPVVDATSKTTNHSGLLSNLQHPIAMLLLQIIVIIVAARLMGTLFRKIGQPAVIGEMAAGIMLGPSLLGWAAPELQSFIFPAASLPSLQMFSQIGVILFMFLVGVELDMEHLRERAHTAIFVSHASIVIPFFLGTSFSLLIYRELAPQGVSFAAFALFIGISMSITAFPVLARILEERGLSKSPLGTTAIACAAIGDVTAWCILAIVVAIVKSSGIGGAFVTIGLTLLFCGAMFFAVQPCLKRLLVVEEGDAASQHRLVASAVCFVFISALCTEVIGIHALFGAFLAGAILPQREDLRVLLTERLESFSASFLLPLVFAFTGLRTQLGAIEGTHNWLICAAVIAVAVTGKLGGSMVASRWTGQSWRDSFVIGALMNTRGLMELIVLNLGYDLGILSPPIFAMMVLMALTTTCMTAPLLTLAERFTAKTRSTQTHSFSD